MIAMTIRKLCIFPRFQDSIWDICNIWVACSTFMVVCTLLQSTTYFKHSFAPTIFSHRLVIGWESTVYGCRGIEFCLHINLGNYDAKILNGT